MPLLRKPEADQELDAELRFHIEQQIAAYIASGLSLEEASRRAHLEFGGVQQTKESVRDVKWFTHLESLFRDIRFGFRQLRKNPAFVAAVVISIGLGIAANSTIFSLFSSFVLRPAPVGEPASLLALRTIERGECCNHFSGPLFQDIREQAKSFSGVAAYYELVPASVGGKGEPERVWGQLTTANYFDVAQLHMEHGRGFASDEEHLPVIVLSHRLWQRRFSGDPAIVGKSIALSGRPFTVVGVTPPAFGGLDLILDTQFWVPLGNVDQLADQLAPNANNRELRGYHWLAVIGRIKAGVTRAQTAAELKVLAQNFSQLHPDTQKDLGFHFDTAGSLPPRDKSAVLLFLTALSVVALLVLCIACGNVANLFLAHASARQREMAVRLALGASKTRLLRQVLTETVLLALGGGLFGLALSFWATQALSTFHLPVPIPLDLSVSLDWKVLFYTFLLSIGTGVLFGLAPAWTAMRTVLPSTLKGEDVLARPGRVWSLRNVLVIAQIAMSLILLCATGLFLRSLENASRIEIGFRSRGTLMMSIDPRVHGYNAERTVQFLNQLQERVAGLPGVTSAACTDVAPLSMGNQSEYFSVEGHPAPSGPVPSVDLYMATPGYFDTLGILRVAGRDFANEGSAAPKIAVVNESFVQYLFGKENPIGQRVNDGGVSYEIIGVVKNIKSRTLGEETRPVLFRSLAQSVGGSPSPLGYSVLARYSGDSSALSRAVRNEIHTLDPTLAIFSVKTMEEHLRDALFLPRLAGILFGLFGFVGLLLAAVGLYGVMNYSVSRRTREIGIRLALGAPAGGVQRLVIRQGMLLVLIALLIGLPVAFAVAKLSASFLYGVRPQDIVTFTAIPLFLATVALLACWLPARRASRVDPLISLRYE